MRDITRILLYKGKWTMQWIDSDGSGHMISSIEPGREELYDAMRALRPFVTEICEMPPEYAAKMNVTGVTWSYTKTNILVTFQCLRYIDASPLKPFKFHTPPWPRYTGGTPNQGTMSSPLIQCLNFLVEEANRYIDGDRAQTKLIFDDGEAKDDEGGASS